jgi:hypothetical protein
VTVFEKSGLSFAAAVDEREIETEWLLRQFNNDGCPALKVSISTTKYF